MMQDTCQWFLVSKLTMRKQSDCLKWLNWAHRQCKLDTDLFGSTALKNPSESTPMASSRLDSDHSKLCRDYCRRQRILEQAPLWRDTGFQNVQRSTVSVHLCLQSNWILLVSLNHCGWNNHGFRHLRSIVNMDDLVVIVNIWRWGRGYL